MMPCVNGLDRSVQRSGSTLDGVGEEGTVRGARALYIVNGSPAQELAQDPWNPISIVH